MEKICSKCGELKKNEDFPKKKNQCKSCRKKYIKQHKIDNPELYEGYIAKARLNNKTPLSILDERILLAKEGKKKCRECDKIDTISSFKEGEHLCKVCSMKLDHANYLNHLKNGGRETRSAYQKDYNKQRVQSDIEFKLICNMRARINQAFTIQKVKERLPVIELLGCTVSELKTYIESKFTENMSWENYNLNGVNIGYIKACNSFNLNDIEQQKKCFHYTNLIPVWKNKTPTIANGGLKIKKLIY